MEIKSQNFNNAVIDTNKQQSAKLSSESDMSFSDELNDLSAQKAIADTEEKNCDSDNELPAEKTYENQGNIIMSEHKEEKLSDAVNDLATIVTEFNKSEQKNELSQHGDEGTYNPVSNLDLNPEFNSNMVQSDEIYEEPFKLINNPTDNEDEGIDVINNDFSIENKDKLPSMNANTSFNNDGQLFSSFMNNSDKDKDKKLTSSVQDLAEEAAILSTMAENIAMVNKATLAESVDNTKTVVKEDGIKKVDTETNIVKETIVKYDNIVMNETDVELFTSLVENKEVNLNDLKSDNIQKSVKISKTLADMLAKAMEDNKPIRIEFDNGISVIIKISKDGKLSADFLPSTQIAEAYLKENLPLLKQKLNEQNIDYDELNRRERKNQGRGQSSKKGRDNE